MLSLQKLRKPIRALITRTVNEVELMLVEDEKDIIVLKTKCIRLNELQEQIMGMDQDILGKMTEDEKMDDEDFEIEVIANEGYINKIILAKTKIDMVCMQGYNRQASKSDFQPAVGEYRKRQFKLPKIELPKFSGKLIDWLGWWALFKKIHEDEELAAADKFHYLIQSTEKNTRAYEVVNGYPPTEENYPKVINALHERFGKKKLLTQIYIRELFQMGLKSLNEKPAIATIYDKLVSHVRSLESLNITVEQATLFLYPMVESSLPDDIMIAWQRSSLYEKDGTKEIPPKSELNYLLEFLQQEVEREEQRSLAKSGFGSNTKENSKGDRQPQKNNILSLPTAAGLYVGDNINNSNQTRQECIFCGKNSHAPQDCYTALRMSWDQKLKIIKEKKGCHQCLKTGHTDYCRSQVKCTGCLRQHVHLMCPDSPKNKKNYNLQERKIVSTNVGSNNVHTGLVILKTILLSVKTEDGPIIARALLDDGSHRSYVTSTLARKSRSKEIGKFFERNTLFGGILSDIEERTIYKLSLNDLDGKMEYVVELPNKDKITGNIKKLPKGPWLKELKALGIRINDYDSQNEEIDILIGADLIPSLTTSKSIKLKCGLQAVETKFGWTIMGPLPTESQLCSSSILTFAVSQIDSVKINQLWDLESIGIQDPVEVKSIMERNLQTKNHFLNTVCRSGDGRYRVALPWVDGIQQIPNNFVIAKKRLINTTKKLKQDCMYETYDSLFKQWEQEDFIEEVKIDSPDLDQIKNCHFIPHHPVFKLESKTTPVRPVFDASCKIGRHPSLNECLEKGPNLIELIPAVMIRFREGKIGVASDIRKAFQMIEIQEQDQNYLQFLWWEHQSSNKIKVFKHKRVVFGVKSSPFILGAVIDRHLDTVEEKDLEIAKKLKKSLYVDNSLTSVNSMAEYFDFKSQATRIMAEAKMELRQWENTAVESPRIGLNQDVGLGDDSQKNDDFNFARNSLPQSTYDHKENISSVLGMQWNKQTDTLSCATIPMVQENLTKRTLLAAINKVFDPMGILSPAMVFPKLMLQAAWLKKVNWDDRLPNEIGESFKKWYKELHYLKQVEIPRNMKGNGYIQGHSKEQLHVFCDASKVAYAAVAFLRVENADGISIQLIQAKARIAPINKLTIPRMELMGCVISARLAHSIQNVMEQRIPVMYWSDATTALAWIKRNDEWGTFVGNRVREILKLSATESWKHVPGKLNPADFPSRGCTARQLLESKWWEGPQWLKNPPSEWPSQELQIDEDAVNVERKRKVNQENILKNVVTVIEDPWYSKKDSHILNLRMIALLKRFIHNCQARKRNLKRIIGHLTTEEIDEAEMNMINMIQKQVFPVNANLIAGLRVVQNNEQNIYHVVTKLLYRQDSGRFKKPPLLPNAHPVVDKLIMEEHLKYGHAGVQFLANKLRERFWIIHTKKAVKRIIKKCVVCIRFSKAPSTVPAAPLPENRVKNAHVFEVIGIDLAGPLYLKNNKKEWVVIFTCAVLRAVHMELVEKIDTEQFILALERFIYRRGRPSVIYTDNGTNFKKTAAVFGKLDWDKIIAKNKIHRITWIFNPPAAPWWGGFWERLIRILKDYLRRILGHNKLTKSELDTSICFVESIMNGRPLTYVSENPDDLIPLTPSVFIQDIQQSDFPEVEELNDKKLREKLRHLIQLKQELRERFRSEYLSQLVQMKKHTDDRQFELGEVVLIASENKKRLEWPMARIVDLFPGKDGVVRVAKLKTLNGELVRPLQRLIPLEVKSATICLPGDNKIKSRAILKQSKEAEEKYVSFKKNRTKIRETKTNLTDNTKGISKEIVTRYGQKVKKPLRYVY